MSRPKSKTELKRNVTVTVEAVILVVRLETPVLKTSHADAENWVVLKGKKRVVGDMKRCEKEYEKTSRRDGDEGEMD